MNALTDLFTSWAGEAPATVELLPLSGSARKYYRLESGGRSAIGCTGTSPRENKAFLAIDASFTSHGLAAPEIYGVSADGMEYLQEDLGDGQLFAMLGPAIASGEYGEAETGWLRSVMQALPSIQFLGGKGLDWAVCFPDREFNSRMVNFDLNYFKYDFLKITGIEFDEISLQDDFDRLAADSLDYEGDTFMYRDFQARNVMMKDGKPHFIDFQGGRRGPIQYDLASFLWNAGTHFSPEMRRNLERTYLDALKEFTAVDEDDFYRRYRLITLVRLLQEMGAYGFRGMVERKQLFIDCIPTALGCIRELVSEPFARYPYLTDLLFRLSTCWDGSTILPGFSVEL